MRQLRPAAGGALSWWRAGVRQHLVPHGLRPDGVLGGQRGTAEHDEQQDEVGEPGGVDDAVTQDADPAREAGVGDGSGEL